MSRGGKGRRRPWRAVAYQPNPLGGRARELVGQAAAITRTGLDGFVKRHRDAGHAVDRWRIDDLEDARSQPRKDLTA